MSEIWRTIPNNPNYEVSSLGRVMRITPDHKPTPRLLNQHLNPQGYFTVSLADASHPKGWRTRLVHQLVAETFLGPRPDKMDVSHLNGNRQDNRPENLCYETRRENLGRRYAHGTMRHGETHGQAKITEATAKAVFRARHYEGLSIAATAERFGVSKAIVSGISARNTWRRATECFFRSA